MQYICLAYVEGIPESSSKYRLRYRVNNAIVQNTMDINRAPEHETIERAIRKTAFQQAPAVDFYFADRLGRYANGDLPSGYSGREGQVGKFSIVLFVINPRTEDKDGLITNVRVFHQAAQTYTESSDANYIKRIGEVLSEFVLTPNHYDDGAGLHMNFILVDSLVLQDEIDEYEMGRLDCMRRGRRRQRTLKNSTILTLSNSTLIGATNFRCSNCVFSDLRRMYQGRVATASRSFLQECKRTIVGRATNSVIRGGVSNQINAYSQLVVDRKSTLTGDCVTKIKRDIEVYRSPVVIMEEIA